MGGTAAVAACRKAYAIPSTELVAKASVGAGLGLRRYKQHAPSLGWHHEETLARLPITLLLELARLLLPLELALDKFPRLRGIVAAVRWLEWTRCQPVRQVVLP